MSSSASEGEPGHEDHDDAAGGAVVDWNQISEHARKNMGLETSEMTIGEFTLSVTIPAIVAELPGGTVIRVAAPLTGVVTDVFPEPGQSVKPG